MSLLFFSCIFRVLRILIHSCECFDRNGTCYRQHRQIYIYFIFLTPLTNVTLARIVHTSANYCETFTLYKLRFSSSLKCQTAPWEREGNLHTTPLHSTALPLGVICSANYLKAFRASNIHQVSSPRRQEKAKQFSALITTIKFSQVYGIKYTTNNKTWRAVLSSWPGFFLEE
jgi:hypothetical protein